MPLDPNISLQIGQGVTPPPNPLAIVGQYGQIANTLDQNQLINQAVLNQKQQLVGQQQQQGITGLGQLRSTLGGLLADPELNAGKPITNRIIGQVLDLGQSKILPDAAVQEALKNVPGDATGQMQWLRQHYAQLETAAGRGTQTIYGQPGTVSNGQALQPGVVASPFMGGGFTPSGQSIQQYPSRAELMTRTPVGIGPNGVPLAGPIATVTPQGLGGPAAAALGDGGYNIPPALRNPNATPGGAPGGVVPTGLGPAQQAALGQTGTTSADAFQQIASEGVKARQQDAILGNMQADVAAFVPGPGQNRIKNFQIGLQKYLPGVASAFGVDPASVGKNESFDKLAAQIADAQGAGSDARLAVNLKANPSSANSKEGISLILNQLRGNAAYLQARATLASQWPNPADRAGFEAQIGANVDPRAFQYAKMTGPQKADFMKATSDPEAIIKSYLWLAQRNLVPSPNAAP